MGLRLRLTLDMTPEAGDVEFGPVVWFGPETSNKENRLTLV